MLGFDRITFDQRVMGGRACVRGMRVTVALVLNLVSTGMSSTAVLKPLAKAGVNVQAVLAIFTYGLPIADRAFAAAAVPLFTLSSFPVLIEEASRSGSLTSDELNSLDVW